MKALISVSDKTGVVEFAKGLVALGWEILSTSGTMKLLKESGVPVTSVSDVTGFPEICDGRVKTLHPKIHGALLARRDIPEHMKELKDNGIETIDLVCVNLYPFRQCSAARPRTGSLLQSFAILLIMRLFFLKSRLAATLPVRPV